MVLARPCRDNDGVACSVPARTGPSAPNRYAPLMIVVIGHPLAVDSGEGHQPAGTAALAALEAVRAGAEVQLVGKIGDDDAGDEVLVAFGRAGVGHVAVLRDPSRPTPLVSTDGRTEDLDGSGDSDVARIDPADPEHRPTVDAADIELGLRYLTDFRCVLIAEPLADSVVTVAADAARYAGAELIVVTADPSSLPALPAGALIIGASETDTDGTFAVLLGRVAAAVDTGESAAEAFASAAGNVGATRKG
jgi:hypothetical protein